MTRVPSCPHEDDVLDLAAAGNWPARADATLQAHAAACPVCADLALVASSVGGWQSDAYARVRVPDAGHVWRQAQQRARLDATRRATHPVLAVELVAMAAVALLVVLWGPALAGLTDFAPGLSWLDQGWRMATDGPRIVSSWWQTTGWPASVSSTVRWGLLTLAAWAVILPIAFSLAGLADRMPRRRSGHSGPLG